jgi:hypothetical protein
MSGVLFPVYRLRPYKAGEIPGLEKFSCEVTLFPCGLRVIECGLFFASVIAVSRSKF